jgi:hypothetical protein
LTDVGGQSQPLRSTLLYFLGKIKMKGGNEGIVDISVSRGILRPKVFSLEAFKLFCLKGSFGGLWLFLVG